MAGLSKSANARSIGAESGRDALARVGLAGSFFECLAGSRPFTMTPIWAESASGKSGRASSLRRAKRRSNPEPRGLTGLLRFARNDDLRNDDLRNDDLEASLEPLYNLSHVLDLRGRGEAMADQLAPFLEVGGTAEIDGVVFNRFPGDEQAIATWMFDRAPQFHAAAALGALENRRGAFHAGLEFAFHAGLDFDLRDFS